MPDLDPPQLRSVRRETVAYLTVASAPRCTAALLRTLDTALAAAQGDPDVQSIVISVADGDFGPLDGPSEPLLALLARIDSGSKRVYAALSGAATGAGTEIVLACDGIYGSPASSLSFAPDARPTPGSRVLERARALARDEDTPAALAGGTKIEAIEAYTSDLYDGILVDDILDDIFVFAAREAHLPRGRYHASLS